ncbi:MAG: hypothetical protein ACRCS0_01450 [Albidovulum sp.]
MLYYLFRAFTVVVGLVIILALAGIAIFALSKGAHYSKRFMTNTTFAADVFGGLVPYDRILDSQVNNSLLNRCSSVVVQLSEDAPDTPPSRMDRPFSQNFGGDWQKGPTPWLTMSYDELSERRSVGGDAMAACAKENWDQEVYDRVRAAARDEATWWSTRWNSQIYSKQQGLAVHIYWQPL